SRTRIDLKLPRSRALPGNALPAGSAGRMRARLGARGGASRQRVPGQSPGTRILALWLILRAFAVADLTPREIVSELDRYIVGQDAAKRAVAVAVRNRWRRQQLPPELRKDVTPKNIILIGPTGVGKTEIARRLAQLVGAPFVKVEATKYTEVGYVGRDVESMVRSRA